MDLTFHRARQSLTAPSSRLAFTLGLGVVFAAMIVFSLLYSGPVLEALADVNLVNGTFRWALSAYVLLQLGFTTGIHWDAASGGLAEPKGKSIYVAVGSVGIGFAANFLARKVHYHSLEGGEVIYRIFLAFYGLLFPAYVWLCMLPGRWITPPTRRQWMVLTVAVLIAVPMFWMSFIEQKMIWVLPGIAVPLAARLLIRVPVQQ
jgi:hypothetical protein